MTLQIIAAVCMMYLLRDKLKRLFKKEYFKSLADEKETTMRNKAKIKEMEHCYIELLPSVTVARWIYKGTLGFAGLFLILPPLLCLKAFPTYRISMLSAMVEFFMLVDLFHLWLLLYRELTTKQFQLSYVLSRLEAIGVIWLSFEIVRYFFAA